MIRLDVLKAKKELSKKTLEDIVEETGLSYSTVSGIFSGRLTNPQIDTLDKICKSIGLTLSEVFSEGSVTLELQPA